MYDRHRVSASMTWRMKWFQNHKLFSINNPVLLSQNLNKDNLQPFKITKWLINLKHFHFQKYLFPIFPVISTQIAFQFLSLSLEMYFPMFILCVFRKISCCVIHFAMSLFPKIGKSPIWFLSPSMFILYDGFNLNWKC